MFFERNVAHDDGTIQGCRSGLWESDGLYVDVGIGAGREIGYGRGDRMINDRKTVKESRRRGNCVGEVRSIFCFCFGLGVLATLGNTGGLSRAVEDAHCFEIVVGIGEMNIFRERRRSGGGLGS
jgi:hypothetical protein